MSLDRIYRWAAGLAIVAVWCYFLPPFHVSRVGLQPAEKVDSVADFVERLWNTELPAALDRALEIKPFLAALDADFEGVRSREARHVGLSDTEFYFVRGSGTILEIQPNKLVLGIAGVDRRVCIKTGVIVDNSVRDATGLVDVNQFSNLQDFNRISDELNHRVKELIVEPISDQIAVGDTLEFVGCAQVKDAEDFDPFCLVPIKMKLTQKADSP